LFFFRDQLATAALNGYLDKKFSGAAHVAQLHTGFSGITLLKTSYFKDVKIECERINIFPFVHVDSGTLAYKGLDVRWSLNRTGKDLYSLNIAYFKFKNKIVENAKIPLRFKPGRVEIMPALNCILGPQASWEGFVDYRVSGTYDIALRFSRIEAGQVLSFFYKPSDVSARGDFSGMLQARLTSGRLSKLKADLHGEQGGEISVYKEAGLTALKRYLDEASYRAVVDGFKNYQYNNAVFTAVDHNEGILLKWEFVSGQYGKRDLAVILHNTGGEE